MKHKSIRTLSRMAALALALTLLASCAMAESLDTAPAAEPYIELSTQYPALTVKAGDSLTFAWRKFRRAGKAPLARAATRSAWCT